MRVIAPYEPPSAQLPCRPTARLTAPRRGSARGTLGAYLSSEASCHSTGVPQLDRITSTQPAHHHLYTPAALPPLIPATSLAVMYLPHSTKNSLPPFTALILKAISLKMQFRLGNRRGCHSTCKRWWWGWAQKSKMRTWVAGDCNTASVAAIHCRLLQYLVS